MSDLTYDALFKYAKYFSVNYFDSFDVMETSAWRSMKETACAKQNEEPIEMLWETRSEI